MKIIASQMSEQKRTESNRTSLAVKEDMKESGMSRYEKISGQVSVWQEVKKEEEEEGN